MLLLELFPEPPDSEAASAKPDANGEMHQRLQQAALDLITPMLGQNVPFITMQQVIAGLNELHFGIVITPDIIMDILDPDQIKAIDKIEGDRIYLAKPGAKPTDKREVDQNQQERDQAHTSDMAAQQINQELKQ